MGDCVQLPAENLYVIRCKKTAPNGDVSTWFYHTPVTWGRDPLGATVFQRYESAEDSLVIYHRKFARKLKWPDLSTEVLDIVPYFGQLAQLKTGVHIERKP